VAISTAARTAAEPIALETAHKYRWIILVVLWTTYVVVFLNRLCIGPLGPFVKDALQLTNAQIGMVLSAASTGYLVTQVPIGWVADRTGARWPIALGEFLAGAAMIGIFALPTFGSLLTLMFVTGVGCGFLAPSTTRAVVVWFPQRERATVMGLKQTAVNMGGIIGAATLPSIALAFGWQYGFLILGLVAIGIGCISLVFYREPPTHDRGVLLPQAAAPAPLREVVRNREIWLVAMGVFFLNWVELAMIGHFVLYLTKGLSFDVRVAGGMLAIAETAGAIVRPVSGLVSDRMFAGRRKPVFVFFAATSCVMCFVLGLFGSHLTWELYPVIFLFGIGAIGFGGMQLTLLSELGGRGGAAQAAGFGSTIGVGGSILGPIAFGYVVDVTGSYDIAWLSSGAVAILSVVLLSMVDESKRKM
jgi:MFS transporter, ACS family, hexuronate transporter